ncbi:hypothetical protein DVH05_001493 [Phytophthora capsici]|nr:hypothetical protein DVH05_001493 [Phytophthora capsici]
MGCAATITAIWRWKVAEVHPDGIDSGQLEDAVNRLKASLQDTILRYKLGLFPLTLRSHERIIVAKRILATWAAATRQTDAEDGGGSGTRVGFFDGGSRGNPGPGRSGSVIVEWTGESERPKILWAPAKTLSNKRTTNNVAEFVGLQRLLTEGVARRWRGMQVVGDSAMILGLMRRRKVPKARKLQHWFRLVRKLADQGQVQVWKHHYRQHNKTADGLANFAMDTGKSVIFTAEAEGVDHELTLVEMWIQGDVSQWRKGVRSERDPGIR